MEVSFEQMTLEAVAELETADGQDVVDMVVALAHRMWLGTPPEVIGMAAQAARDRFDRARRLAGRYTADEWTAAIQQLRWADTIHELGWRYGRAVDLLGSWPQRLVDQYGRRVREIEQAERVRRERSAALAAKKQKAADRKAKKSGVHWTTASPISHAHMTPAIRHERPAWDEPVSDQHVWDGKPAEVIGGRVAIKSGGL